MFVNGFIVPVPEGNKAAYRAAAETFSVIARDHGAIEQVEAWEAEVMDGKHTDFRKAVAAEPGEKIVFSWVIWPDEATARAAEKAMMDDPRMAELGQMPFDGKRMVYGTFDEIFSFGR